MLACGQMSAHGEHKKQKKLAQRLFNRKRQEINLQDDALARGRDLEKEREEELFASRANASSKAALAKRQEANPAWSARMQMIRDKNTGRERMAKERWNRFAGTESGGGRGL